jgi:hypothetical protein
VLRNLRCAQEPQVCLGASGVLRYLRCAQEPQVCAGASGVRRSLRCAQEPQVCSGTSGLLKNTQVCSGTLRNQVCCVLCFAHRPIKPSHTPKTLPLFCYLERSKARKVPLSPQALGPLHCPPPRGCLDGRLDGWYPVGANAGVGAKPMGSAAAQIQPQPPFDTQIRGPPVGIAGAGFRLRANVNTRLGLCVYAASRTEVYEAGLCVDTSILCVCMD